MKIDNDPNVIYGGDFEETLKYASLGELFIKKFIDGGNDQALIDGVTGEILTYKDILTRCTKMSKMLHGAGIRQNDVVSIFSENRLDYTTISYGTIMLNAIIAPVNTTYTDRELKHSLDISRPKFIFLSSSVGDHISVLKSLSYIEKIILLDSDENIEGGKIISYKSFVNKYASTKFDIENYVREPVKLNDQIAVIFMSSGTTGLPKGCQLSHQNVIACIANNLERVPLVKQIFENMMTLTVAPMFHAMGFMGLILSVTSGFTMVFLSRFDPNLYLETIQKYKVISISVPPPIVLFLAKTALFNKYDLSSLKVIMCGAAPLTKEIEDAVKERFNGDIFVLQAYGQTESTLGVLFANIASAKSGSVGEVVKGTYAKVIDTEEKTLGPNKVGELCFKGPFVMKGYIANDKATNETIDNDGWLRTGDLGYYDEDKQFFIVDRLKELIKYKAFQVPPAELEGLLLSHSKILDCGVIGIPDESAGELPFAFVVKKSGVELTEQEVKDFVAKNASNAKWLRGGVKFIDDIPKNPTGKILRRELRDFYKNTKSKL